MSKKAGRTAKLYRQTTGTRAAWPGSGAAPNLSEVTSAGDISLRPRPSEGDASSRNSIFKEVLPGLIELELTVHFTYDPSDTNFIALRTAMLAGSMVALAICDGTAATAGTKGFWADWAVVGWDESPGLEGAWGVDITLKPHAESSLPPAAFTTGA